MEYVRDLFQFSPAAKGAVLAIGNFDGVHLGHRAILDLAHSIGTNTGSPWGALTFEPHPRQFFTPNAPDFRLTGPAERASRLRQIGANVLVEVPFDAALASLSPQDFVRQILHDHCQASHVIVGADFCFGKGRAGTAAQLQTLCQAFGIGVTVLPLRTKGEVSVSSSRIREALQAGKPGQAADLLGHWHRIEGPVLHGEKRGRDLGYPTANMSLKGRLMPAYGVYAVLVDILDGAHAGRYHGAASIGVRPMFGENAPNCETFIFDFSGDIYGAQLSVGLVAWLRGEETFDSLDALITQMQADCEQARALLAAI